MSKKKRGRGGNGGCQQAKRQRVSQPTAKSATTTPDKPSTDNQYPPEFFNHGHFAIPTNRFVDATQDPSLFRALMEHQYVGFVVDKAEQLVDFKHTTYQQSLYDLEQFYRYDFTQPHGLNTPIARTFVTRTCVGVEGSTYKYLGLRMFAHPWEGDALSEYSPAHQASLRQVLQLNRAMVQRGNEHSASAIVSTARGGSSQFNLTLINRMRPLGSPDELEAERGLKKEACFDADFCSVSWHADSTLEAFSTIGVYQAIKTKHYPHSISTARPWKIATRIALDAEGPSEGRARRMKHNLDCNAPPLTVDLPNSGMAYFMLGAYNHHHQHAVLAGETERWASTHRVCKMEGHSFPGVLARAKCMLKIEKRGLKEWANSTRMLDEVEFEWLRQWYIQGPKHAELHKPYWADAIKELTDVWVKLEEKEQQKLAVLRDATTAVESKLHKNGSPPPRKQRKSAALVAKCGGSALFNVVLSGVRHRKIKRNGWAAREKDSIWKRVPREFRPIPFETTIAHRRAADTGDSQSPLIASSILPYCLDEVESEVNDLMHRYEKAMAELEKEPTRYAANICTEWSKTKEPINTANKKDVLQESGSPRNVANKKWKKKKKKFKQERKCATGTSC
jgi:alpha-ketoglutarate-dependent dioxygenase FTO